MKVDLKGKVALVTGAAQGIGLAIADTLARNDAQVVYTDRNVGGAEAAAKQSGSQLSFGLDVSEPAQIEAGVARVIETFGRLDILVNNAGMGVAPGDRTTIDQFKPEAWDRLIKVDLTGLFLMSRAGSRQMVAQKSGRIINISSQAGSVVLKNESIYCMSKAAINHLTRCLAFEWAPYGITVNSVSPTFIFTDGTKPALSDPQFHQHVLSHIPLGRIGNTIDVAGAVVFLASPASSLITGANILVDGGWSVA